MEKPENIEQYTNWLKDELGHKIDSKLARHFESVSLLIRSEFEKTDFWKGLKSELVETETTYRMKSGGYLLLMTNLQDLVLDVKKFGPFLLKTGRKNVFENKNWPSPPSDGWITPENWFSRIDDVVRTMVVVKYLDGVEIVVERIKKYCKYPEMGLRVDWEAREEGYYAAHIYIEKQYSVPTLDFDSMKIPVKVEIQVTTQLQEAIYRLTHKYYEERREKVQPSSTKWQWDYDSEQFIPNYLGHILHYVEGMIMEVRNREVMK